MASLLPREEDPDIIRIRRDMEQFVDGCFSQLHGFSPDFTSRKCPFLSLDVIESKDTMTIKAEIPGLDAKDFSITLHGDSLTIKGEKRLQTDLRSGATFSRECRYGPFERTVRLGREFDESRIEAVYQRGVLAIILRKPEGSDNKVKVFTAEQ
jgi:HSP20 family protein